MEFKQLMYFYEACKDLNFSKTAQRIYLTQQAVSKNVAQLEQELNVTLFHRGFSGVQLTEAGKCLKEQCEIIGSNVIECKQQMKKYSNQNNRLRLGMTIGVYTLLPPAFLEEFSQQHPEIVIDFIESRDLQCEKEMGLGTMDLAITVAPSDPVLFEEQILLTENVCAVIPVIHPFAKRAYVTLEDLREQPVILQDEEHRSYFNFLKLCQKAGFEPNIAYKVIDLLSIYDLCAAGKGIGFTLEKFKNRIVYPEVVIRPVKCEGSNWSVSLIKKRGIGNTSAMKAFLSFASEYFISKGIRLV